MQNTNQNLNIDSVNSFFTDCSFHQKKQLTGLFSLYDDWNSKINVISRKDMESFYERHVIHSLGIAKVISFRPGSRVLDVGTGGGFPGIPLAILFPETRFYLIDSIGKKIKVVKSISQELGLKNVETYQMRAENFQPKVDFVVSRAVTRMEFFVPWVKKNIKKKQNNKLKNGILYLKGGDLSEELMDFPKSHCYELNLFFNSPFFETKKVVHLPL
jgi:16S rRNA (guanine527-N7)-methyltransferase